MSAMTTAVTIKPGTAKRLGLRRPLGPLQGIIRLPPWPEETVAAFMKAFEEHKNLPDRWQIQILDEPPSCRPPPSDQAWLGFASVESRRERRKRLGLHWWQRESAHYRDGDQAITAEWERDKR